MATSSPSQAPPPPPGPPPQNSYEKYKEVLALVGGYLPAARILMQADRLSFDLLERSALKLQRQIRRGRMVAKWLKLVGAMKSVGAAIVRLRKVQAKRRAKREHKSALQIQARFRNNRAREAMRMAMRARLGGSAEGALAAIDIMRRVFDSQGGRMARRNQTASIDDEILDTPTAIELVLVGDTILLAELSSTA